MKLEEYDIVLGELESFLKSYDITDSNKIISAYTLYKTLYGTLNPLYESLSDEDNLGKLWNLWLKTIRHLDASYLSIPYYLESSKFRIIPSFKDDYNGIILKAGDEKNSFKAAINRNKGSDVLSYNPEEFTNTNYNELSKLDRMDCLAKYKIVDLFIKEGKENISQLIDLLDKYVSSFSDERIPSFYNNKFNYLNYSITFNIFDYGRINAFFEINDKYSLVHSHWSNGRQPLYQFIEDHNEELLKKFPIPVN